MCSHDSFDILFYDGRLMIRKCTSCHEVEMVVGGEAVSVEYVKKALAAANC